MRIFGHVGSRIALCTSTAMVLTLAAPAVAQNAPAAQDTDETSRQATDIVVTGSRIQRSSFDSPTPVMELARDTLLERGAPDLAEALADLPGVDLTASLGTGQTAITDSGLSTISLRALGSNRTLTLIDGRRTVSNSGTGNVVSLSTVPEFFVDRVEVMTGGASAIYGSDAISGVVNIITLNKFEGVRARVVGGTATQGGAETLEVSALAGTMLDDDRLSLMIGGTYAEDFGLMAAERDYALESVSFDRPTNTLIRPNLSTSIPGGRFLNRFYYDETGLHDGYVASVNGYEARPDYSLITRRVDYSVGAKAVYEFSPAFRLSGQFLGSWVTTHALRDPDSLTSTTTYGLLDQFRLTPLARTNPLVPAVIAAAAPSSGVSYQRRATEVGYRTRDFQRDTYRFALVADGTFGSKWKWNLGYSLGIATGHQFRGNGLNLPNVANALDVEVGPDGALRCRSAEARGAGCVPLNIFGVGSISKAAADYIRANGIWDYRNEQQSLSGYVSGSPFALPAGDVQTVVGFELRRDKMRSVVDAINAAGLTSISAIPQYRGQTDVKEAFAELSVPLLADRPLFEELTIDGALRISDYSIAKVGTVLSFRAGGQWSPVKGVRFRGEFSRASRAPDLTELNAPAMADADTVFDPCSGVTAATTGGFATICRSNPGVAAAIASSGVFTQETTTINGPSSGNLNLKHETANTLTLGVVVQPFRRLRASVDYYDIKIRDAIAELGNEVILSQCYNSGASAATNRFCGLITRDAAGQITRILNPTENLGRLRAAGLDFALGYGFGDRERLPGDFTLSVNGTRRLKGSQVVQGVNGPETTITLGQYNDPKFKARFAIDWKYSDFGISWSSNVIGRTVDSNIAKAFFKANGVTNPLVLNIAPFWRHDLNLSYSPEMWGKKWKLFVTARDLFDAKRPFLPIGSVSNRIYNTNAIYGLQGRTVTGGVQVQF
ncbi:MAG: TonB-dependent receptor plug domain-containing protein [Pseudorhodoplanes sp.]